MTSAIAIAMVERAFLEIKESEWLPQWSFDFWIIPYFLGRGVPLKVFRQYVSLANLILRLEFEPLAPVVKHAKQEEYIRTLSRVLSTALRKEV
jgi:hypothetical protein